MEKRKGSATVISIGTMLAIVMAVGVFWNAVAGDRQRISTLEEAVSTIKGDTLIIKQDIKILLTR